MSTIKDNHPDYAKNNPPNNYGIKPNPLNQQIGGSHYKDLKIQPVEYIHANKIPFIEGCIIKYATRWRTKDGLQDLKKIIHFAELLIKLENSADISPEIDLSTERRKLETLRLAEYMRQMDTLADRYTEADLLASEAAKREAATKMEAMFNQNQEGLPDKFSAVSITAPIDIDKPYTETQVRWDRQVWSHYCKAAGGDWNTWLDTCDHCGKHRPS